MDLERNIRYAKLLDENASSTSSSMTKKPSSRLHQSKPTEPSQHEKFEIPKSIREEVAAAMQKTSTSKAL